MSGAGGFTDEERAELLALVLETFEKKKIILTSGRESDFYFDLRQTLMKPRGVELAGKAALAALRQGPPVEAVGGILPGEDSPLWSHIAVGGLLAAVGLSLFGVRKRGSKK